MAKQLDCKEAASSVAELALNDGAGKVVLVNHDDLDENVLGCNEEVPSDYNNTVEQNPRPSDALLKLLVEQAEFYFSDSNVANDSFLLKHIQKHKDGFVSLKLVASFRKVKKYSKDWKHLACAVENMSEKLELNTAKTKLRRKAPLPHHLAAKVAGEVALRSVIATNLKSATLSPEEIRQIFSACGEVATVHVFQPGQAIPMTLQKFLKSRPEVYSQTTAFIEYVHANSAQGALKHFSNCDDWRSMQVYAANAVSSAEDLKAKARILRADRRSVSESDMPIASMSNRVKKIERRDESSGSEYDSRAKERPPHTSSKVQSKPINISSRLRSSFTPASSPDVRHRSNFVESPLSSSAGSLIEGQWITQRRLYSGANSESGSLTNLTPSNVSILREPLAPDGTKGFLQQRRIKHR